MTLQTRDSSVRPHDAAQSLSTREHSELIDVRTPEEFAGVHAEGARSVPLDTLEPKTFMSSRNGSAADPLYVICQSGARGAKACARFRSEGFSNVFNVLGGTAAWEKAGLPVVRGTSTVISLERQVRISAGSLVLAGLALGLWIHPAFFALSAFVAAGLVFAGITNTCGMGMVLAKMPWNRINA